MSGSGSISARTDTLPKCSIASRLPGLLGPFMITPNTSRPDFLIDAHLHYRATDEWGKTFVDVYTRHFAMACILVPMKQEEINIIPIEIFTLGIMGNVGLVIGVLMLSP